MKLEVGKWYKHYYKDRKDGKNTWYLKYIKTDSGFISGSEWIDSSGHYYSIIGHICYKSDTVYKLDLQLSEIIPFLPKNHPDRNIKIIHEIW